MIINYQNISKWANLSGFRLALRHPGITHTSFLPIIELQTWADWAKFEKNQFWSCKQQEGRTTKIRIFNMCSYGLPFWKSNFFLSSTVYLGFNDTKTGPECFASATVKKCDSVPGPSLSFFALHILLKKAREREFSQISSTSSSSSEKVLPMVVGE